MHYGTRSIENIFIIPSIVDDITYTLGEHIMMELKDTRHWSPTTEKLYEIYTSLEPTQKLKLYIKTLNTTNTYSRLTIEIPYGLQYQRNFNTELAQMGEDSYEFQVETIKFIDYNGNTLLNTKITDVTCATIIDEQ